MSTPVEQIKQRLSIIDVVSSYVKLTKAGKSFKGKSPFTNERTPSFFVSPDRNAYYCFSTSKGGDIFTFIQEMEGVDFRGALKILAERAGVELTPVDPKTVGERDKLFALLEEAMKFFVRARHDHPEITAYLKDRGLKDETIEKWNVGFALPEWRGLRDHLVAKGYTEEFIFRAGLLKKIENKGLPAGRQGKNGYDVFRNRVMFPIADSSGRTVGFSGRTMEKDPATPKYVNSPETELFEKSYVLFGYDKAKTGIRALDFSLVVEGQFDLVLSHQAGYTNAVAISGTALTPHHVELLGRLSNKTVLALDADQAGINSAKRSAALMLARGMDVKVARIQGGKDPADLVKEDPKLLKSAVGNAKHVVEFLLDVLAEISKDDRAYKLRVREEVIPFLALIPSAIDREHFEGVVAERIGVSTEAIRMEVGRAQQAAPAGTEAPRNEGAKQSSRETPKRASDVALYLYGLLLSLESEAEPHKDLPWLKEGLELALGRDSMQALLDWPPERRDEAIFKAEALYTGETNIRTEAAAMLYELYIAELRRKLGEARERLKAVEKSLPDDEAGSKVDLKHEALATANDLSRTLKEAMEQNPFS